MASGTPITGIAQIWGVSRTTVYRFLEKKFTLLLYPPSSFLT
ncbi:helix-turn-helix domain-containing protein [Neobacillus endophyticus]|nr:helix-turn-helix domain-containing protein [Neobacillus endophyticus]